MSNHYGNVGFGHYTAFCKNPITDEWLNFDDTSCSLVGSPEAMRKNIVSNAAYSLFYRLRDHVPSLSDIDYSKIEQKPDRLFLERMRVKM